MQFSVQNSAQEKEFIITGDLTTSDEQLFFSIFKQVQCMTEPQMVINLKDCSFVDSAGMGMLITVCEEAAKRNVVRVIRYASAPIKSLLCSVGFENFYYFQ